MRIKDFPNSSKPREKFLKKGPEYLSDAELFAIILRTGTKKENVVDMSNRLIKKYGLNKLFECSLKELQKINGIGPSKAMQLLSIAEIIKRNSNSKLSGKKISSAKDVFNYFYEKLKNEKQENFFILILNSHNLVIHEELITKGILDSAILHPREVFKPAIKNSASKIVLVHNHPSGNPNPSEEDLNITEILIESGNLLGIKVLDHVIVTKNGYWSWIERNESNKY